MQTARSWRCCFCDNRSVHVRQAPHRPNTVGTDPCYENKVHCCHGYSQLGLMDSYTVPHSNLHCMCSTPTVVWKPGVKLGFNIRT